MDTDLQIVKFFVIFFTCTYLFSNDIIEPIQYNSSNIQKDLIHERVENSHIKVFIPSIPYTYLSRLINGTLFRLSDSKRGWEYMMATSYTKIDSLTYDINLRKNIKFQDGTYFDADSVVKNMNAFIKQPFTYTDIHNRLKSVEKISKYKVRFHLSKPYGMFLHDLARINLYSNKYLDKFAWQGKATGDNTKEPGKYGLGPYILIEGYATGRAQTPVVKLKANPYYYEEGMPYIENITIYTQLKTNQAVAMVLENEGQLDISPIPFNKKTEATLSKYAKLITRDSTHNIAIYFNLLKEEGALKDKNIRVALNKAINQNNLLNFVYKKEGEIAPTAASVNYASVKLATTNLRPYGKDLSQNEIDSLKKILNGLHLKVVTQDRFMFLWKGIEYQLNQFGVSLDYEVTTSEKDIYTYLLTNRDKPKDWDMLTWGNDDWYGNHPWNTFFAYRTTSKWSAIDKDEKLQEYIDKLFYYNHNSESFNEYVKKIVYRVYDKAYMLFVPSPNIVLAVNKEVYYKPFKVALMPLWKAKISKYHWSVRKGNYPKNRENPMLPIKANK